MTADSLRERLDQEPFKPFKMCLTSGEEYEVRNPHMVALMRGRVFVAMPDSEQWAFHRSNEDDAKRTPPQAQVTALHPRFRVGSSDRGLRTPSAGVAYN